MGQPLVSVSPIAGEVLSCDMTIGSYVSEGDGPMAVVADLSTVWVRAFVKERYFGAVQEGDSVEIHVPSAPEVDPESRALEVIVECDNAARSLKLGMFCNVLFFSSPVESFILPATALMQESGSDFVYQSLGDGTLLRKPVVSETLGDGNVRILSGLEGGETVMTRGGIFLNAGTCRGRGRTADNRALGEGTERYPRPEGDAQQEFFRHLKDNPRFRGRCG